MTNLENEALKAYIQLIKQYIASKGLLKDWEIYRDEQNKPLETELEMWL